MDSVPSGIPTGPIIDFVVIGAMKAGTTHLHSLLSQHPGINMSSIKETNFFCYDQPPGGDWALSKEWYRSLFQNRPGLRGEASPNYAKHSLDPRIAQRIFAANPKAKLIYLLRDPTARAVSHYLHNLLGGRESRAITDVLQRRWSHYLRISRYHEQLQPYLKVFPKNQILLLPSEVLFSSPKQALTSVYDFLGVPVVLPVFMPTETHTLLSRLTRRSRKILAKRKPVGAQKDLCDLLVALPHDHPWDSASFAAQLGFTEQHRDMLTFLLAADIRDLSEHLKGIQHFDSLDWLPYAKHKDAL